MMKKLICRPLSDRKTGSDIMIRMNMTASARKCGKGLFCLSKNYMIHNTLKHNI